MSGGNLNEYLGNGTGPADWGQRLNIAVDVAKGLENLHSECKPRIIHRDMKSENILLDENLVAKVADFGISKILPENVTSIITKVMGTCGYLDPEYERTETLNVKSDIYSYGIVLYELITGKPAIFKIPTRKFINVSEWVRKRSGIKRG
ncbi:putative LRR receptor-like serine/threonine-protein kinase [Acorus calamus]|uniref:non-specific serine/threonine protein kinase n=1 Tax=Acorus calamus TaxID=4465 RepID=A0AAV9CKL4_ACOCL|nr:putative LRR receptor-like serine/threonine-protein kinase [Acorus calamus]